MDPTFDQPSDDQMQLMLYLADELSESDRQSLEIRLAADRSLNAELEQLRALGEGFYQGMQSLDGAQKAAWRSKVIGSRVHKEMAQWTARRLVQPSVQIVSQQSSRTWYLAAAAAAVVLIGVFCWWSTPSSMHQDVMIATNIPAARDAELIADGSAAGGDSMTNDDGLTDSALAEVETDLDVLESLRTLVR